MLDRPLGNIPWTALDFEGAGEIPGHSDVPIQVGLAQSSGLAFPASDQLYRSFIAVHRPVSLAARKIHGIGEEHLKGAPELFTLWPDLKARLQHRVLVAHNASVERRYLRAFPGHGFGPWVDTLHVARRFYPQLQSHRLGDLVSAFGLQERIDRLCPGFAWHDALYDAVASLAILQHVIEATGLADQPLRVLKPTQGTQR